MMLFMRKAKVFSFIRIKMLQSKQFIATS